MAVNDPKPLPPLSPKDIKRFWSKVDKRGPNECWPWIGNSVRGGYGVFRLSSGEQLQSHRISFFLRNKRDPYPFILRHSCDYPACQNDAHLLTGTTQDNMADKVTRGRTASGLRNGYYTHPESRQQRKNGNYIKRHPQIVRGESNGNHKLTAKQVREIRRRYIQKYGVATALAREFGVSQVTISRIGQRTARQYD
jgi:hypothetical protein